MRNARDSLGMFWRWRLVGLLLCAFFAASIFIPRSAAQSPLRRLTTTGDVLDYVWSATGDALLVTRAGEIVRVAPRRRQVTADLYRIATATGTSDLLAANAQLVTAAPSGTHAAFVRLFAGGDAQLVELDLQNLSERGVDKISWGAQPQYGRAGDALLYARQNAIMRAAGGQRSAALQGREIPLGAKISPGGDRAAFVDARGLVVTQESGSRVVVPHASDARVLPLVRWSHSGIELAYVVTHSGFEPEIWIVDTATTQTRRVARASGLEYFANLAWSPDDHFLVFTRTPAGSASVSESEIWRAATDGTSLVQLTHNQQEETLPQYAPDGRTLAFLRGGDLWVVELDGEGIPAVPDAVPLVPDQDFHTPRAADAQRTPPSTIRVYHDAANACRSVPVGQIDTLNFETYVKRVVPAEVFSTWDDDALMAQAVAARSYAWFWILQHGHAAYDVTDSTAYQYMCDTRYASTDAAADQTRGQYLDYQGNMVFAAYGAENGDPTLTNSWGNPYLIAVDDPVGFMKTRAGNGLGMSQWGAQRWASQFGWDYQQILRHYYSDVTLEAAQGTGEDVTPPVGALVAPWSNWGITSNRVRLVVNASDDDAGIAAILLNAEYLMDGSHVSGTIATLNGAEREFTWDVSALPNQREISVIPQLFDGSGNSTLGGGIRFDLDRKNPHGSVSGPATTTDPNVTLNVSAQDNGSSGLETMMFSNDWTWEGEKQRVEPNSGNVVADPAALNGSALRGLVNVNSPGAWYGPYATSLPANQPYRAYFRLKTDDVNTAREIALLDVVADDGAKILGLKRLRGVDFRSADTYQEFYVDFHYPGSSQAGLEFRVAFRGAASLWLDRILVVRYPVPYATSAAWTLTPGNGKKRVIAKFADGAENISEDAIVEIVLGSEPPPTVTPPAALLPRQWLPLLVK